MKWKSAVIPAALLALVPVIVTAGEQSKREMIRQAESAAPDYVSKQATILDRDGNVIRKGSNGWTCMPNTMPDDNAPVCADKVWMEMMSAMGNKEEFQTDRIGVAYMLQGDQESGVSNSDPFAENPKQMDDYVAAGPHLMLIVPREQLEGMTDDPSKGGPWVMWKDTPYAHVMMPIGEEATTSSP